ncbi:MAG: 2-dehydro-3-deoxyphosphogalactonate aldolase [bacterium]|jgi:2-dehydro-3-deoxyphosphogalactonate aldolase
MNSANVLWLRTQTQLPLIAILRGIQTSEALAVASALQEAGFSCLEVPLNSPEAFRTIEVMVREFGDEMLIGAGTVLTAQAVTSCVESGAKLIVAPNLDESVAHQSVSSGCVYCPGVATPTEAFHALKLGATALKLFPAELVTPPVVKAMRAVLPSDTIVLPVGGISPANMMVYCNAGANGFGLGSGLYKPGKSINALKTDAQQYVATWRTCEIQ